MTWNRFFVSNVLLKDRLFRQIHQRVIRLTPGRTSDILTRQKEGRLTKKDQDYLEALETLKLRNNALIHRHLETCFKTSEDWTHA